MDGKRILIVDDNATNRRMLTLQATRWGMHVQAVSSGAEALACFDHNETYEVAVLDMQMPEMDGLMLARTLAERPETATLPILMLSSMGRRKQADAVGVAAWLTKPTKQDHLRDTLIRVLDPKPTVASPHPSPPVVADTMAQQLPLRLLLAEDNLVNQKVLQQYLHRLGYRADVVANGLEALAALRRSPYDVVLMDVQMPEMDGLEATRAIRAEWTSDQQPIIIAITANAMQTDRQRCLDAGMDAYLSKPVRMNDLAETLRRCVVHHHTSEADMPEHAKKPAPPSATPSVLALDDLRDTIGDADDFIHDVLTAYLANTPGLLTALHQAYGRQDAPALHRAAHSLKSSSQTIGARAMADLCETLEQHGCQGTLDATSPLIEALDPQFNAARQAIEQYLQTNGNGHAA